MPQKGNISVKFDLRPLYLCTCSKPHVCSCVSVRYDYTTMFVLMFQDQSVILLNVALFSLPITVIWTIHLSLLGTHEYTFLHLASQHVSISYLSLLLQKKKST